MGALATRLSVASDGDQMGATETVGATAEASKIPQWAGKPGFGNLKTLPLAPLYYLGILVRLVTSLTSMPSPSLQHLKLMYSSGPEEKESGKR